MNSPLIPVISRPVGSETIPTVNARTLHEFLEVGTRFNDWMKRKIDDFGFVQDTDFVVLKNEYATEYALTLDMAKELSMVERNAKGKQARQYFIECERRVKDPLAALSDPNFLRATLITYTEKVIELEHQVTQRDTLIADISPKAQALDRISTADGLMCITNAAKALQKRPKDLFKWLHANNWIYRRPGGDSWIGYELKLKTGVLQHKTTTITLSDGTEKMTSQVLITGKGLAKLAQVFPLIDEDGKPVTGAFFDPDPKATMEKFKL